jgi:hypothetical protein
VVCFTTPGNATRLAQWLNESPASPIFARRGEFEGFASRGEARIRGFFEKDEEVLALVRKTVDPLGGSETFHTAYYSKARFR